MATTYLRRHRAVELVVVAALAVLPAVVCLVVVLAGRSTPPGPLCDRAAGTAAQRRGVNTGDGPSVVVIGDSYAVGVGVGPRGSWPVRLPGRVHVDAFSGSGFSEEASPCGPVSYADRARRAVGGRARALVVVAGGLNDVQMSDAAIRAGFRDLMAELVGHRVLVVGPPPAPTRADLVPRVDALLAQLSAESGAAYLSMAEVSLDYRADGLHPSSSGQDEFGDVVAAEVAVLMPPRRRPRLPFFRDLSGGSAARGR